MNKAHHYFVYILCSKRKGTLYVGVTNNLIRRIEEHKSGTLSGFTQKYNVKTLVYFEAYGYIHQALYREKRLKTWKRAWKLNLIEKTNPEWEDLYYKFF